jgi:uncharacterized membrane protein YcaP (DUF421 family)
MESITEKSGLLSYLAFSRTCKKTQSQRHCAARMTTYSLFEAGTIEEPNYEWQGLLKSHLTSLFVETGHLRSMNDKFIFQKNTLRAGDFVGSII